jgi:putative aminopeptidase FrvX
VRAADRDLLQTLLAAYGPGGQEDDVREVCCREPAPLVDGLTVDPAGDVVGLPRGTRGPSSAAPARLVTEFPCRPTPR